MKRLVVLWAKMMTNWLGETMFGCVSVGWYGCLCRPVTIMMYDDINHL